jgi:hypothetical protein
MGSLERQFISERDSSQREILPSMFFAIEEREWKYSDTGKSLGRNARWIGGDTKISQQVGTILNEICGTSDFMSADPAE